MADYLDNASVASMGNKKAAPKDQKMVELLVGLMAALMVNMMAASMVSLLVVSRAVCWADHWVPLTAVSSVEHLAEKMAVYLDEMMAVTKDA